MGLVCQFVDSISATPTVRLDLNLGTSSVSWTTLGSTDFGLPERRYAIASTMLVNGGHVAASSDELRTIRLRLQVRTASADDTATQVQKLIRELDRETNLLKTQLGTTPVFFHTFRSSPSAWQFPTTGALTEIHADIFAKPYASGLMETPVSAQNLDTDPANSNGNFVDIATVKGDVDAPAFIRWPATAVAANRETLFAVRQRGTPSGAPFLFQAEAQTNGTDTTDQANASFSGGNGTRTTFGTTTMVTRSTISDLGTASVDLRGQYRVYARYAKTVSGDTISVRIQWGTSGGTVTTNDTVTLPSGTSICMVDLGMIQVPRGQDPTTHLLDGSEVAVSDTFHIAFQASRSGSGNLDLDYFILVPADDRLSIVKWVEAGPSYWWLDGSDHSRSHARNASDQIATAATPAATAPVPSLKPNQSNRLYMVYEVGSGLATTLTTVAVTVSYFPQYMVATRPVST